MKFVYLTLIRDKNNEEYESLEGVYLSEDAAKEDVKRMDEEDAKTHPNLLTSLYWEVRRKCVRDGHKYELVAKS